MFITNQPTKALLMVPLTSKTDARGCHSQQKAMMVAAQDDIYTCPVRAFEVIYDKMDKNTFGPFYSGTKNKKQKFDAFVRVWRRAAEQAGIPEDINAHSMRASVATELNQLGFDQKFINHMMRWKPNSLMTSTYDRALRNLRSSTEFHVIQK